MALVDTPTERHLLRARDFMDAHYREPIDVATVARAAHLSPAHFARQFRKAFGETPHQYLLTRRMERAAALLRNTDYNVAEICMSVGLTTWARSRRLFAAPLPKHLSNIEGASHRLSFKR